jgi:hypothetical protein
MDKHEVGAMQNVSRDLASRCSCCAGSPCDTSDPVCDVCYTFKPGQTCQAVIHVALRITMLPAARTATRIELLHAFISATVSALV